MFATLSLHRLAIILAFLMSVNILLLLAVPYVFYICDDIVTCDELRSDNVTKVVKVDADNYVDGFFQNLKLPMKLEQSDRSFGSSLHYQLPFFYGYYRLGVISDASIVSKKVYKNVEQGSLYQNNFFAVTLTMAKPKCHLNHKSTLRDLNFNSDSFIGIFSLNFEAFKEPVSFFKKGPNPASFVF